MTGFNALPMVDEAALDGSAQWSGVAKVIGPPWARFPAITIGLVGVQVLWSIEMAYASPYLISLGLSKSLMALVFIAGPLSGLIVQPLIGVMADNSKSRFGRRRPFIAAGVALCSMAMILLGFTRNFASIVTKWGSPANNVLTIWLAVLSIYCIDFSINAVQAVDRALLVDTLPRAEQAKGNAWAAIMLGIGSVGGFFFGGINMPSLLPFLGQTELEVLSIIGSIILIGMHLVTITAVKERILLASGKTKKSFYQEICEIWVNARRLPPVILRICLIQFFAWSAWFPILFYTTLYISDLYKRSLSSSAFEGSIEDIEAEGNRLGSRAQLFSSLLALATNFLAPLIIEDGSGSFSAPMHVGPPKRWWQRKVHLATLWAVSHLIFALCMFGTFFTGSAAGATVLMTLLGFPWAITQWAPFSLLAEAIHTTSDLGEPDIDDNQSILLADTSTQRPLSQNNTLFAVEDGGSDDEVVVTHEHVVQRETAQDNWGNGNDDEVERDDDRDVLMGNVHARRSWADVTDFEENVAPNGSIRPVGGSLSAKAGIILGIHNIFIVVPQFLVTGLTALLFAILEPHKSVLHGDHPGKTPPILNTTTTSITDNSINAFAASRQEIEINQQPPSGPNSVAIIFRIGGIWALIAFVLSWRLATELRRHY
ncbi:major facilitator superfamily domain-containing protein [Multifurca ochricompacta]|uniref:Major facilitator superfamily domain-containing protein n=1 Tax=Multifurca ochricompacta TaxID=376703 RepID=A0AAD4M4L4_9AGAM|nr:major facilitator superfamily domain-containing protein [Multifurca ochricompacta]